MNIALYADTPFPVVDGVGRVVEAYAETLTQEGHSCFIAAPKQQHNPVPRDGAGFEFVRFAGIPVGGTPYKLGMPFIDLNFNMEIDRHSIDVVHVHSPFSAGMAGAAIAKRRGVPLVGTFHSKFYDDFYQTTRMKIAAEIGVMLVVEFYKKCDEVWSVSQSTADTLREYGFDGEIIVMNNGTDPKWPDPAMTERVKQLYNPEDKPVILFAGQMNWKKNQMLILNSCAELKRTGQPFRLIFAGQGSDFDAIKSKTAELGLAEDTVFPGHITDKAMLDGLYFASDLFFFPSYYDNAPMVVREAAAAGVPSMLARGSTAAEVIRDGVNGLLCPDDPKKTAVLLQKALADPARLCRMGENAKETVAVSWDQIMSRVLARYEHLIAKKAAASRGRRLLQKT